MNKRTMYAALLLLVLIPVLSVAQIPRTLSYQGTLTDTLGNAKADGSYLFTFRLYQQVSGGSAVWSEQKTVDLKKGLFHTVLGDQATLGTLAFDRQYWLGVQFESESELLPRVPLSAASYSLRSAMSDTARYAISAPLQAAVDSARVAAKVSLPFSATNTAAADAFGLTNTGSGNAMSLTINNPSNTSNPIRVATNGIGSGVSVSLTNASNGARGVDVLQAGVGPGVFATSAGGNAVWGITSSISAAGVIGDNTFGEAVVGRNRGGNGVGAVVGRNDSSGYGVRGFNTHGGIGVLGQGGISGGTGLAGRFENVNASSGADAFEAATNGTGRAALFTSGSGSTTYTLAGTQMENYKTTGEAIWARTSSASNVSAVVRLNIHPSATGGFIEGWTWDGGATTTRKFHITTAGTFVAGSDFAEALTASGDVSTYEPGDVVVLASDKPCSIEKTSKPYDTRVAGVYSTRPGVLGADKDGVTNFAETDIPVAIVGIVPTKVTDENGAIQPGDLLTTSSTPGYAMKASPVTVDGVVIYASGVILGKALEQLEEGKGIIKVLINLR